MYVRVRYPGSADCAARPRRDCCCDCGRVVAVHAGRRSAACRGRRVVVAGTVAPRKRVVTVVFQQRIRGRWRKVGHARGAHARAGASRTSFVPAFRAAYRYYAVAKSDLDTDRGASKIRSLRVR